MAGSIRLKLETITRVLGRWGRKTFLGTKPLVPLSKAIKRLRRIPLEEPLVPKDFKVENVTALCKVIPIVGFENMDAYSPWFMKLFKFNGSTPEEKTDFMIDVMEYVIAKIANGAGDLAQSPAEFDDEQSGDEEGDEVGVEDRDDRHDGDSGCEGEPDAACVGQKCEKDEEGNKEKDDEGNKEKDDEGKEKECNKESKESSSDEVPEDVFPGDELVSIIKAICDISELEIFLYDTVRCLAKYYEKEKVAFPTHLLLGMVFKAVKLSKVTQDYTRPLIKKHPIQTFCLALNSEKLDKLYKKSFQVALYNQRKDLVLTAPLGVDVACQECEFAAYWIFMWLKMQGPQKPLQHALDSKVECVICTEVGDFKDMAVLDKCTHSFCLVCMGNLVKADIEMVKRLYAARCPLCKTCFWSYTTQQGYIELRNRLLELKALDRRVPDCIIPDDPVDPSG